MPRNREAVGFCKQCDQQVLLARKDFDICLAVILLIFTVGIGLLIYLAIYYSKPEDRCIHCGFQVSSQFQTYQTPSEPQFNSTQEIKSIDGTKKISGEEVKFCALCGEKLGGLNNRFCENCGAKV